MYKHNEFVVFLDVDGVLNTRKTCETTPNGYTGIDDARVAVLTNALERYGGGDIVLTSDWKNLIQTGADYSYLVAKLDQYGLAITGHTRDCVLNRGYGILSYLDEHPEIEEFVVLDDKKFDFKNYKILWDRLLLTNGIEKTQFASETPAVEALLFRDYIREYR